MRQKYYQKFHNHQGESSLISSFLIILFCLGFSQSIDLQTPAVFEEPELASALLTSNSTCHQLVSSLHMLSLGVDITKFDLLPLRVAYEEGFKNPVIDFSCKEGKTWLLDDVKYDLPDQVISITNKNDILRSEVYTFKKPSDFLKVMSTYIGLDSIRKGFFTASATYKRISSAIYNESRYVAYIVSHQSMRTAQLVAHPKLKLDKYVQMHVDRLLPNSFESDPEQYFRFIEYFGTHYFSKLDFGGTLLIYLETEKNFNHYYGEGTLESEARFILSKFMDAKGGYEGQASIADSYFTHNMNKIIRYYGGYTNFLAGDGISQWQSSISKKPWILGGEIKLISDLIDDKSKRKSMEKAIQIYIDKTYIDSLMILVNWATIKYPSADQQISANKDQVKALNTSDHNAVIKLGNKLENQLEVPEWFVKNYKLCFKWEPIGDERQCGSGVGRYLCAKIGTMTSSYKDNPNERGKGCNMQWGIKQSGHIQKHWLRQIKICFRWWPDGDPGQCGGGAARTLCASVNKFTPKYRDKTDGRDGGCRMQWRLLVPDAAPIWYRSLKLCFDWYSMYDESQCDGGAKKMQCAMDSNWTTAYLDNTNHRNGYCRIRWGILLS